MEQGRDHNDRGHIAARNGRAVVLWQDETRAARDIASHAAGDAVLRSLVTNLLEHGRIIEQGRGPDLVARGSVYAKLYAAGNFPTRYPER